MPGPGLANLHWQTGEFPAVTIAGNIALLSVLENVSRAPVDFGHINSWRGSLSNNFELAQRGLHRLVPTFVYHLVLGHRPAADLTVVVSASRTDDFPEEHFFGLEPWAGVEVSLESTSEATREADDYEPITASVMALARDAFGPADVTVTRSFEFDAELGGEFVGCRIDVKGLTRQEFATAQQRFMGSVSEALQSAEAEGGPSLERFIVSAVRRE